MSTEASGPAPSPHEDLACVQRALDGDELARDTLAQRLERLPSFCRWMAKRRGVLLSPADSADLLQNVVLSVWSKLDAYDGRGSFERWVCGFVGFEVRKWLDRRRRGPHLLADEDVAVVAPESKLLQAEEIRRAVETLGDPAATIVREHHLHGHTFEEISQRVKHPVSTVKSTYYRSLERLRLRLRPFLESNS